MAFCVSLISLAVETYMDQMYCARRSIDTCPCCAQRCLSKRQPMTRQQIDCRSSFRPDSRQPTLTYIARFIIASDCANRCPTGRHMKEKKLNRRRPDYVGPNLLLWWGLASRAINSPRLMFDAIENPKHRILTNQNVPTRKPVKVRAQTALY